MTTQQDSSLGIKKETTYGTPATPDHFYEYLNEDFDYMPTFVDGQGMHVGRTVKAADRRVVGKEEASGSVENELFGKGLGALFEAAMGTAVSTVITGAAFQQLFTPTTSDFLPSYTIQVGIPPLGGGAANPQTYAGCVCSGFDLSAKNGAIPTVKFHFLGKSMDTSTGLTAPSYPTANPLFSFIHGSLVTGSITAPTTTALAAGGTSVADIRDAAFTWSNSLDSNGFNFGSAGQRTRKPALGDRSGSGTLTAEYDNNTLRDAWKAQTDLALVLTFATTTAITGATFPTIQFYFPDIRLDGEMPKPASGDVITQSIPFTLLDNRVAAAPFYVAIVTAETAI